MSRLSTQKARLIAYLGEHGIGRSRDLIAVGITATTIARAKTNGIIEHISRGLYQLPNRDVGINTAIAEISKRHPKAVICLVSALAYYGLTDQIPRKVWIAIDNKAWEPKSTYPRIRVVRFRGRYYSEGIVRENMSQVSVPIYTLEKSIADAFRNPKLVDRSVAIESLKTALAEQKSTPSKLAQAAKTFGAWNKMRPYLEALTSNG